jgi:GNAT superfamily N-acetyltransferase
MEIRDAREDDAPVIAALLGELGYQTAAADLPLRLERLAAEAGAGVLVATAADEPIGVLAYAEFQPLERPAPTCRIMTLVVSSGRRREGVAAALLDAVESRARERGCSRLEVTTQPTREAALGLYLDAGYAERPLRLLRMLDR